MCGCESWNGRRRVEERREGLRAALAKAEEKIDRYTRELHQLGLQASEPEVRWLDELIAHEQAEQRGTARPTSTDSAGAIIAPFDISYHTSNDKKEIPA